MGAVELNSVQRDERLAVLLAALYPRLVAALAGYSEMAEAEDVAQDALLRAWERRADLSTVDDATLWVFRVAINRARSRRRRAFVELRHLPTLARGRSERDGGIDDRLVLRSEIRRLPDRRRAAVVLRYYADLSVEQTAGVMGCAPGTVKALTSQGLRSLRSRLEETSDAE